MSRMGTVVRTELRKMCANSQQKAFKLQYGLGDGMDGLITLGWILTLRLLMSYIYIYIQ